MTRRSPERDLSYRTQPTRACPASMYPRPRRSTIAVLSAFPILAIWIVGFGAAAARLAFLRGRSWVLWAIFGAILGPAAVVVLWVAPPGRCATCDAPTQGWLTICGWCGNDVRPIVAPAVRPIARDPSPPSSPVRSTASTARTSAVRRASAARTLRQPRAKPARGDQARPMAAPVSAATSLRAVTSTPAGRPPSAKAARSPGAADLERARARSTTPAGTPSSSTTLASGIFITGNVGLTAGSRYTLEIEVDTFRILGPVDVDPSRVALERPLRGIDATAFEGRLIVNEPNGASGGVVLAFMSLAGGTPASIADAIVQRASGAAP